MKSQDNRAISDAHISEIKQTALRDRHVAMGAKMGEFAGYDMPLYYGDGVLAEHHWVREKAGLFDVSHMGQAIIKGPDGADDALRFIECLTPSSFGKLKLGRTKYTVLTNPQGGIIDDLMVTHAMDNGYHLVFNGGCKEKDIAWLTVQIASRPEFANLYFNHMKDWALLAIQGPSAELAVKDVLGIDLSDMPYMSMQSFDDRLMYISRLGYTGEDGFEIAVPNDQAGDIWDKLCAHDDVKPIGLAARDSLRLEMGYPLYGHDIDDSTSPVEADLNWIIGKDNRGFYGADRIERELAQGPTRRRVGIILNDKGVARENAVICDDQGNDIGIVTSGGPSPILGKSIAMGYVPADFAALGTPLFIKVRTRQIAAEVAALPFVPAKTKAMKKPQGTKKTA